VVALESSVLAQGLAIPHNRVAAERMTRGVESTGAEAAITAIVHGVPTVGLAASDLERFLARDGVRKVSSRDLAWCMTERADGATTVAATLTLASAAGVEVFATGGIGGVHRDAPFDESADLVELARTPMIVVCAGAKSILDLPATMERLETLGVTVIGYRTRELPGFFTIGTGIPLTATAESPAQIAELWRHHRALGRRTGLLVVQPPPSQSALDHALVERATAAALERAAAAGVRGGAVTPFLLAEVERQTNGASVQANLDLLEANAVTAGQIAVALARATAGNS
jgi:pseudouridine-5'-phosphate glycosidase